MGRSSVVGLAVWLFLFAACALLGLPGIILTVGAIIEGILILLGK